MSLDDLNREQKRQLKRQGALNDQGMPTRGPVQRTAKKERVGLRQYMQEVRDEMRKVAWPTWAEVRKYSIVVLVTVVVVTAFVFGLDSLFGVLSSWLYG